MIFRETESHTSILYGWWETQPIPVWKRRKLCGLWRQSDDAYKLSSNKLVIQIYNINAIGSWMSLSKNAAHNKSLHVKIAVINLG